MNDLNYSVNSTPWGRFETYQGDALSYLAHEKMAKDVENILRAHPSEKDIDEALSVAKTLIRGSILRFNRLSDIASAYYALGTFSGYQKAYETALITLEDKEFFSKELPDIKSFLNQITEALLLLQTSEAKLLSKKIRDYIHQI